MPHLHQINISSGGVPKLPVLPGATVRITRTGVEGDAQHDTKHHGGPERAVCLFSLEIIDRLRFEGHPIYPGAAGENLTIAGLDWTAMVPGVQLRMGNDAANNESGPILEVVSYTKPCSKIRNAFKELDFNRIKQELHPGESRVYARVLREGAARVGDACRIIKP